MNTYLLVKCIHIISSTVLFGTGLGIAYFKWTTDRNGDIRSIRVVSERVVFADWLFTTPAIIVQPITGIYLASSIGYPISQGWVAYSIALYILAGACWIPVVWLQLRMRDISRAADERNELLPDRYFELARAVFWLGIPAFLSLVAVFCLMVSKPG